MVTISSGDLSCHEGQLSNQKSLQSTENKNTDFFRDSGHERLKFVGRL